MTHPDIEVTKKPLPKQWEHRAGLLVEWWTVIAFRATISTLGLLVIGWLLFWPDQTRDVLAGIEETLVFNRTLHKTSPEIITPKTLRIGVTAYINFWLTGLFLAFTLGLIARVTGVMKFSYQRRMTLEQEKSRQRNVRNYSIFIFFSALFVVHFAYITSGYYSNEHSPVLMATMFMVFTSAVVLVPWFLPNFLKFLLNLLLNLLNLLNRWGISPVWGGGGILQNWRKISTNLRIIIYLVIAIVVVYFGFNNNPHDGSYIPTDIDTDLLSGVTPVFALIIIFFYRLFFPNQNKLARDLPVPDRVSRSTIFLFIQTFLILLLFLVLIFVTPYPAIVLEVLYAVGSISIVFVWLAWLASALGLLFAYCILYVSTVCPSRFFSANHDGFFTDNHNRHHAILVIS